MATRPSAHLLRYAYMRLARELDARFENLLLTGRVSKWYSEVGNEATTVVAGLALEPGDSLCTLHRDLGAILPVYLDPARTFPELGFGEPDGPEWKEPREIDAFTGGAVLFRRTFLEDLGGFDERYFLYYEDVDLALRGAERGWCYRERRAAF